MLSDLSREGAEASDAADPIGGLRERFLIPDPDLIYLDGNSLGRLPADTPGFLDSVIRDGWGVGLIRSWDEWIDWGQRLGDRLAKHVLGAMPGEVTVSDSTSVNLYKLASAAVSSLPDRKTIIVDDEDFPTNRYIMRGLADERGMRLRTVRSDLDNDLELDQLRTALDRDVAVVVLSLVSYRSGSLLDMAAVNEAARECGALVLWDLSHAAGSVPIELETTGADLAVGCTYKYLNGGPGSPAFLYVHRRLHSILRQPIWGWFGQREQFQMGPVYDPVPDVRRFLVGTPPVLSLAAIDPALTVFESAGVDRIRAKSLRLGQLVIELADRWLAQHGFRIASPREPDRLGSHVALEHPDAEKIRRVLAEDAGVVCDYRVPNRLRIGPSPLYTRFVDVWDAMRRLRELVAG